MTGDTSDGRKTTFTPPACRESHWLTNQMLAWALGVWGDVCCDSVPQGAPPDCQGWGVSCSDWKHTEYTNISSHSFPPLVPYSHDELQEIHTGPYLAPSAMDFLHDACIAASLHPAQSWFPPQQPGATTLLLERSVVEKQRRVPVQRYLVLFYRSKKCANVIALLTKNSWSKCTSG